MVQVWFQLLVVATIVGISAGKEPNGRPVYAAPREEDRTSSPPRQYDDELRQPANNDGPRGGYYGDPDAHETKEQTETGDGFVEPLDFNSFLTQVGNDKKSNNLPLFASASNNDKDYFSGFFGDNNNNNGGLLGLSSSASNQNSKKVDESGFVDPNVQFRSLFDSAETATGFRPQDFLGNKDDSYGSEPSKGSQTRTFPSFTYTGREDDDDVDEEPKTQAGSKFRSSYRQVDGRDRNDDRQGGGGGGRNNDPYDDGNYYDGEYDDSPAAPPNPRYQQSQNRYQQSQNRYQPQRFNHRQGEVEEDDGGKREHSPVVQESQPAPRAKASESKNSGKCKKVEKQVDDNEDYASFAEPDGDYDAENYRSRYKRQTGGGGGGGGGRGKQGRKRPMTCYVCEDEQGRYAERCSYDSKADPSQGNYFTSSSSSYNDNGKSRPSSRSNRGRGGTERYRRTLPVIKSTTIPTTVGTTLATAETRTDRNKRQDEYARSTSRPSRPDYDYEDFSDFGFGDRRKEPREPQGSPSDHRTEASPYATESVTHQPHNTEPSRHYRPEPHTSSTTRAGPDHLDRESTERNSPAFDFGPPSNFNSGESLSSGDRNFDFSIPREYEFETHASTSNNRPSIRGSSDDDNFGLGDFSVGYEDYVKKYFPGAFGSSSTEGPGPHRSSTHSPRTPAKEHTQQSHSFAYPPYEYEDNRGHLSKMLGAFNQKDRSGCHRVNKGDMTCYVCRDSKGMNKEECMYAEADPTGKNTRVAYEESTEYSSPQATVLLRPINLNPSINKNSTQFRK